MPVSLRRNYVDRRIFVALLVLATFSLITTVVTIVAVAKMVGARQEGIVYSNARTSLMDLMTQLTTAESAQRGYILTGDATYLAPYDKARKQAPADINTLKQSLATTKYEPATIALAPLASAKLAELASTVAAFQSGGQPAALAIVTTGQGQKLMDSVRAASSSIATNLNGDINSTRDHVNRDATVARDVGLLALGGTLVLVVGIYVLFDHAIEAERALDRAKDEFVSLASHQLRTPATGIKSILSMLEQGDFGQLTEKQHSVVMKAVMSNERELGIIEELLNVAKADAGRLVLNLAEFDVNDLIDEVVGEQQPAISAKHLKVVLKCPDQPVKLNGDAEKLYMAISNLVDNARKYTPETGVITITVVAHRGQVVVEVADSGIGIEEHELDHIFDRFQRARMVLAGTIEGTGLGLYLARRIAELHHGTINVDSKKGHGSRFIMVLPRRNPA